jgi:hypothetical protein
MDGWMTQTLQVVWLCSQGQDLWLIIIMLQGPFFDPAMDLCQSFSTASIAKAVTLGASIAGR